MKKVTAVQYTKQDKQQHIHQSRSFKTYNIVSNILNKKFVNMNQKDTF
jgi:hypothetical protein